MDIVFRVDSSSKIGYGHIMRCLSLADALRKTMSIEIFFICKFLKGNAEKIIEERGYKIGFINDTSDGSKFDWSDDVIRTINFISPYRPSWLVVDNYNINHKWHRRIRPYVSNLMVIDEKIDRNFDCDLLLDQTLDRQIREYIDKVPKGCKILTGSKYSLLRAEFLELRKKAIYRRKGTKKIQSLLVSLGGSSLANEYVVMILKAINRFEWQHRPRVDVVLGDRNYISNIAELLPEFDCKIHTYVNNMWDFILKSDIAFGAGGTSIWERCCLGLPTIAIGIAENQRVALERVHKVGGLYSIGCCKQVPNEEINKAISYLLSSDDNYSSMVKKSLNVCDGQGVNRVCQIMMSNT